jgi:curved DNA-binding protein CbpA/Tfp pilus assembly protein PilZ
VAKAHIVKLRCKSWRQLNSIYKRDLKRGGLFLKTNSPPPLGTKFQVQLTLPSGTALPLAGEAKNHVPPNGLGGRGPGVDIGLESIPQSVLWLIESALASTMTTSALADANKMTDLPSLEESSEETKAEEQFVVALEQEYQSLQRLDPFQILGVGFDANDEELRRNFARLTKRYHPDRFKRFQSQAVQMYSAELFILIRDAYEKLKDPAIRQKLRVAIEKAPAPLPQAVGTPKPNEDRHRADTKPAPYNTAAKVPASKRITRPPPQPKAQALPVDQAISENVDQAFAEDLEPKDTKKAETKPEQEQQDNQQQGNEVDALLDGGDFIAAIRRFSAALRQNPKDPVAKSNVELAEGMKALAEGNRMEAAERFEYAITINPQNERAAREIAKMREQITNERKGLLTRLMSRK